MSGKVRSNSVETRRGTLPAPSKPPSPARTRQTVKPAGVVDGASAEEIDDQKWTQAFDASLDVLEHLAEEASRDFKSGKTKPLKF